MAYRDTDKPLRQIASELGVTVLLEGSVRRADGRVRITAQLVDARDDTQLWAETYDRDAQGGAGSPDRGRPEGGRSPQAPAGNGRGRRSSGLGGTQEPRGIRRVPPGVVRHRSLGRLARENLKVATDAFAQGHRTSTRATPRPMRSSGTPTRATPSTEVTPPTCSVSGSSAPGRRSRAQSPSNPRWPSSTWCGCSCSSARKEAGTWRARSRHCVGPERSIPTRGTSRRARCSRTSGWPTRQSARHQRRWTGIRPAARRRGSW